CCQDALVDVKEFWETSNQVSNEEIMAIGNDLKYSISFPINVPSSKVGETNEFPITLVPLKTGHLLVPLIRVTSLDSHTFSETIYLNNAEQVLVRP
ncbi:15134_t:CDS:2, partial [Funneliformis mosseae]